MGHRTLHHAIQCGLFLAGHPEPLTMKTHRLWVLIPLLLYAAASAQDARPAETGLISLFNGKDLEGWTPKIKGYELGENFGNTFRVENGVIKVGYEQYKQFDRKYGHLFYKDKFS